MQILYLKLCLWYRIDNFLCERLCVSRDTQSVRISHNITILGISLIITFIEKHVFLYHKLSGNWLKDNCVDVVYVAFVVSMEEVDIADIEADDDDDDDGNLNEDKLQQWKINNAKQFQYIVKVFFFASQGQTENIVSVNYGLSSKWTEQWRLLKFIYLAEK